MDVLGLTTEDCGAAIALWAEAGLTRPWNDPAADFQRALQGATSVVLGTKRDGVLVGTVMVGFDGHRGWVYYLVVAEAHQRTGIGSELMSAAEGWLRHAGAPKIQLMVRNEKLPAMKFYERNGYEESDVKVLARWLER
jgi:ribosomal protein S18 acetylase RimI-like enzyme